MAGKANFLEILGASQRREPNPSGPAPDVAPESDQGECAAFGYLRGLDARALAVEFRYLNGNSDWHSYSNLASWRYNPSVGLLLKFTSDVTTLILIRGSNLDALVDDRAINLTDRGFQRHRIVWVREMGEDETQTVGKSGPTIDRIEVEDCDSPTEGNDWLAKTAPQFLR